MVRLKTPLLSMGAYGTIGDALTFQSSTKRKFVREKPKLPYSLTRGQQYQRWLYEDYAYLWRQQTGATQSGYRAAGVRFHLTGFQYWMKYQLQNLPDIIGLWHLDSVSGGQSPDSGRNALPATVVGASPIPGVIDEALYLDGINDWLNLGTSPLVHPLGDFTIEFFLYHILLAGPRLLFNNGTYPNAGLYFSTGSLAFLDFYTSQAGAWQRTRTPDGVVPFETWSHITLKRKGSTASLFVDAVDKTSMWGVHVDPLLSAEPAYIGVNQALTSDLKAYLDHFIFYNRALDQAEITRHSERRYPA